MNFDFEISRAEYVSVFSLFQGTPLHHFNIWKGDPKHMFGSGDRIATWLTYVRTRSWVPMILYMRFRWSNFCIYVSMLLFSYSIVSDSWSIKIENAYNNKKISNRRRPIYS